ncbi:MAG: hypothetical protein HYZ85_03185 [Candidatus Omnitrophica bacterium]|nr:hypothetical protein [Candidatus Omnitrophota bacterium]
MRLRNRDRKFGVVLFGALAVLFLKQVWADSSPVSLEAQPLRYIFVQGDEEKFREHHWFREGYGGGADEIKVEEENLSEEIAADLEGRFIVQDNDYDFQADIEKKNLGYVQIRYKEFSHFYDDSGGVYHPFPELFVNDLDRELELDIGRFSVETGLTVEDWPHIVFLYEHRFKDGTKSRLTWTPVIVGGLTRNIGPSWQQIDESIDTFTLRAEKEIKGVLLKGEQSWEIESAELSREEKGLSTNVANLQNRRIRVQDQVPKSTVLTTTLSAEKWFQEEKTFAGAAYHFLHLKSQEMENIFELNERGTPFNFGNPKQIRNARADNDYDAHTWVENIRVTPWKWLTLTGKLKTEAIERHGNSSYPNDITTALGTPDGQINTTELSRNDNKVGQWGEAFHIRFTAIPRTAIYNEFEFEQIKNWLSEDRTSIRAQSVANANEIFSRETITWIRRGIWTLGAHIAPIARVHLKSHLRIHRNHNDYDDKRETDSTGTTARSAFFDELNIATSELMEEISIRPCRWFQSAFRYQLQARDYLSRVENQETVQTDMNSHIFTWDVTLQPIQRFLILSSVSRQQAWVDTPASSAAVAQTPRFNANHTSWFVNTQWDITDSIALSNGLHLTRANNFDDFTSIGLPLGTDFILMDISAGLRWTVNEYLSLEPEYVYYHYRANPLADTGNYNAHLVSLKSMIHWG